MDDGESAVGIIVGHGENVAGHALHDVLYPFRQPKRFKRTAGGDETLDVDHWGPLPGIDGIDFDAGAVNGLDTTEGDADKVGPQRGMGGEHPCEGVIRILSGVNLQYASPLWMIVLVKPEQNIDMGKSVEAVHGIPVVGHYLDKAALVPQPDKADRFDEERAWRHPIRLLSGSMAGALRPPAK